jgi:S1-C subfamily serine protease
MSTIDINSFIPSIGLMIVLSTVTTTVRRRPVTNTNVSYGSGFIVDGELDASGRYLRNSSSTTNPIVVTVAHVIPTQGVIQYYFKLFDQYTQISKIYKLNLIAYNRTSDIAVFGFDTTTQLTNPLCLQWNRCAIIGSNCYVAGFPLGNAQFSIAGGSVRDPTYCFSNLATGIDQIYHSVPTTNGNSGSCILDNSGTIIGIHAWGLNQYSNLVTFENFCGGPSSNCAFHIVSQMISQPQNGPNKYYARYGLGIQARIIDDIFRIVYKDISGIDGIIIDTIIPNQPGRAQFTIDTYNKNPQTTPKIAKGDIITHIFDINEEQYYYPAIPVGYSSASPGMILFDNAINLQGTAPTSMKIIIRKAPLYQIEYVITFNNIYKIPEFIDATTNNII